MSREVHTAQLYSLPENPELPPPPPMGPHPRVFGLVNEGAIGQ